MFYLQVGNKDAAIWNLMVAHNLSIDFISDLIQVGDFAFDRPVRPWGGTGKGYMANNEQAQD